MSSNDLCNECEQLNPVSLFTGPRYDGTAGTRQEDYFQNFKTVNQLEGKLQCPFCRLVQYALLSAYDGKLLTRGYEPESEEPISLELIQCFLSVERSDIYESYIFDDKGTQEATATVLSLNIGPIQGNETSQAYYKILQPGHPYVTIKLCGSSKLENRPLLNARHPDLVGDRLADVRLWLDECELNHQACEVPLSFRSPNVAIPFTVIDVLTRMLVPARLDECRFVALSYVWGEQATVWLRSVVENAADDLARPSLPSNIPRTIEDAIDLCIELGLRYLWADLYCVNQTIPSIRGGQIEAMDQVYGRAHLVLIAAEGDHTNFGIHRYGKNSSLRSMPIVEVIQGREMTTAPPSHFQSLLDSTWAERAWTYQEGLLARRCLIFRGHYACFICRCGHKRQSDDWSSEVAADWLERSRCTLKYFVHQNLPLGGGWVYDKIWSMQQYHLLLSNYSSRSMTNDDDAINALSGCLSLLESSQLTPFAQGLPTKHLCLALFWDRVWFDQRRRQFASWSWAGWHAHEHGMIFQSRDHSESPTSDGRCTIILVAHGLNNIEGSAAADSAWHMHQDTIEILADKLTLKIKSTVARFRLVIVSEVVQPGSKPRYQGSVIKIGNNAFPAAFDSQISEAAMIDDNVMYITPWHRLRLQANNGKLYELAHPFGKTTSLKFWLPSRILGSSVKEMLQNGLQLVRVMDLKKVIQVGETWVHYVCALHVRQVGDTMERFGSALMPLSMWDQSSISPSDIELR